MLIPLLKPKWNEVHKQGEEAVQGEVKKTKCKFNYMVEMRSKFSNGVKSNPEK